MHRVLTALLVALIVPLVAVADEPKPARIRLLIIDGQNNHAWQQTTPHMKKWLEECGRFTVDVATAPAMPRAPGKPKPDAPESVVQTYKAELEKHKAAQALYQAQMARFHPEFARYDVVLSNYNGDSWPAATNEALESLLADGKIGLVIVHAANNSFPNRWKEYDLMIGMGWRDNRYGDRLITDDSGTEKRVPKGQGPGAGHGPMHPFKVTIRDREHPVTRGMPAEWLHERDELYQGMRGPVQNVHLLATAYADKKYNGSGEHEPMIWTVSYGKGRVFHTPMGHDVGAMQCVGFIATLQRGAGWAATGAVTVPLPDHFPSADRTSKVPAK